METKDQLIKSIKEWVKIDNEIRALQKEVRKKQADKQNISKDLMEVMRKNEIDSAQSRIRQKIRYRDYLVSSGI